MLGLFMEGFRVEVVFLAILRMGKSLMDVALGKGREGIEWSKALR